MCSLLSGEKKNISREPMYRIAQKIEKIRPQLQKRRWEGEHKCKEKDAISKCDTEKLCQYAHDGDVNRKKIKRKKKNRGGR